MKQQFLNSMDLVRKLNIVTKSFSLVKIVGGKT